jgi:hypothetical protein
VGILKKVTKTSRVSQRRILYTRRAVAPFPPVPSATYVLLFGRSHVKTGISVTISSEDSGGVARNVNESVQNVRGTRMNQLAKKGRIPFEPSGDLVRLHPSFRPFTR